MTGDLRFVARLTDLPEGEMIGVKTEAGDEILLARVGSVVYALGDICSHAQAWLDAGWLHTDSLEVECPLHEARFDLRSGLPTRPPAEQAIPRYAVTVLDDRIYVEVH